MFAYFNEYIDVKKPQSRNFYLIESRLVTEMKKRHLLSEGDSIFLGGKMVELYPKMRSGTYMANTCAFKHKSLCTNTDVRTNTQIQLYTH